MPEPRLNAMQSHAADAASSTLLRDKLIEAASSILQNEGYHRLSMRRVAEMAGCSQMAMYRHFKDKDALTEFLCAEIYMRFAQTIQSRIKATEEPRERLLRFVSGLIEFAYAHPDHYSLIFLTRPADGSVFERREELGKQLLTNLRDGVRQILPHAAPAVEVDRCLRSVLFCLHGAAALLVAHPKVYGLTEKRAVREACLAVKALLDDACGVTVVERRER